MKLNVLLAKTDHLASSFKKMLEEYIKFFKGSQGAFRGEKKTYTPRTGTIDVPGQRGSTLVVTTVEEKLGYLESTTAEYIDALFSQEKTNASGKAVAKLNVDGKDFGTYTSLELLRLKSLIETGTLKEMYENIPVRSDAEIWEACSEADYANRAIMQSPQQSGESKSTVKESYIINDPNISKINGANYTPQIGTKDTVIVLGDYTFQKFSGEMTQTERAGILHRRSKLLTSVIEALKIANEVESEKSDLTASKIFRYLHAGKV